MLSFPLFPVVQNTAVSVYCDSYANNQWLFLCTQKQNVKDKFYDNTIIMLQ